MTISSIGRIALPMLASGMLLVGTAFGQSAIQILDRVEAFDQTAVLEMNFDDPSLPDFSVLLDEAGADFKACKLTATRGIFCLDGDGDVVRNWPPGSGTGESSDLFNSSDLGLKKLTGVTVDLSGNIWAAGQARGKTHNLFKIEPVTIACPPEDQLGDYCATLWAADKPLLIGLKSIDGDTAESFALGKGVLGLEERKTAVFFHDNDDRDSTVIASGKRDFGTVGNEQPQSTALLQVVVDQMTGAIENYVLVTTTKDRILAVETDGTPDARQVFDIAAERDPMSTICSPDDPMYGIQSSPKSGFTYVTDNQYCQVLALRPVIEAGVFVELEPVPDGVVDLPLSTNDPMLGLFPVLGPTVAPGEIVDFEACAGTCTIVNDSSGTPAATLSGVQAIGEMILFQIEGIPDCRYIPDFCFGTDPDELGLDPNDIIIDRKVSGDDPAAQLLNITPLLPLEVILPLEAVLPLDGQVPDMWISSHYQGQEEKGYFFNALFGVTDATFQGVFEIEVEVGALTGYERGCPEMTPPDNTPASDLIFRTGPEPEDQGYDVMVKVSEDFKSIDRDYIGGSPDHEVLLINSGCGSTRGSGDRWSLIPIDVGFTSNTFDPLTDTVTVDDDAVFAKLLLSLFDDLEQSVNELACQAADMQASKPLSDGQCMDFNQQLTNTLDKLDKCIDATKEPKQSSRNQTCQAYSSQFGGLQSLVSSFTLAGEDPANRLGEAQLRTIVIDNVYTNLFFPSIPDPGFNGL